MKPLLFMIVLAIIAQVFGVESKSGLKGDSGKSGSNGNSGNNSESTTTPSTTLSTTVPTTSESTSTDPISTTTVALNCGPLANTSCCTKEIIQCLMGTDGTDLSRFSSPDDHEMELAKCNCVLTTTSTTTRTATPTTSSNSNCSWLQTPFNYTDSQNWPPNNFSYYGTCCSEKSIDTLNENELDWLLTVESVAEWNKWDSLVNLLYCVEGACTDPPRWNNCSMSSTSSSSSTSPQTPTSSKLTTSSETDASSTTSNSTSTFTTTAATTETEKGDNNEDTTTIATTTSGSTSETETTINAESSSETTSTQVKTEGTTETGSTGTETTTPTPTVETTTSTTITTDTSSTPTYPSETTATGSTVTTSEDSTTASTSTMSSTSTASQTSFTYGSTDITESAMTTQTSSIKTVTESSTAPTSTTIETTSSASTISQTAQSPPTTESTGTTTSSTGTSGASTTSGTTGITIGNQTSTSTSTTGSTPGTTTNTDGVYFRNTTSEIFPNCTRVTVELIYYINGTGLRNVTYDQNISGCSSTTQMTTPEQTTTFQWPTGGTTRILPSGEIILSESLIAYPNCTTVLKQLIFNPSTNETRTETTTDEYGCRTSTTPLITSTTPITTPVTTPTQSNTAKTTTYNWPTGGTTKILPSGEIILSESLIAYPNCTTVLMQLIFNPSTNLTRTETTTDEYGCRTSSSTVTSPKFSTTPMTTKTSKTGTTASTSMKTTTYNWPTGGTTRVLPSGEIILSESLIAYQNCTTVLKQLIFNPSTNETRTATTTDEYGCKATSSTSSRTTPMSSTTTSKSTTPATTTFPWPTGGTTRTLPNGEIILSESLIAYKNCTTVLMQLIFNPSTNTTRTVTESDKDGCKATSTTVAQSVKTTTYNWPTGGTTRTLPSGEIILSESLIAYKNCTTVLMQLIYNPSTNTTRTETTSDAEGCKATTSSAYITTPMSGGSTTTSPSDATTTFQWPTGGTTRMLPSGEIIISESLIAYKNCTTILMQLIFNPSTNTTRTETTTDANGCVSIFCMIQKSQSGSNVFQKSTSTGAVSGSPGVTSPMTTPTTTETPFTFPDSKTTQILPNGEIILSESLIAYPNCTTVLKQLIFNPATNTTRTETSSDAQGCKATTTTKPSVTTPIPPTTTTKSFTTTPVVSNTASPVTTTTPPPTTTTSPRRSTRAVPVTCPFPSNLNLINTNRPTPEEIKESYAVGERIIHICKKYYIQELSKQPLRIYQCGEDGKWIGTLQKCVCKY
ncbi:hypothetical protein CRE_07709 [Caenorhabditis remanei]|uniref:Sushi domain-containing protein n=1 Tax=Caenorhabditis remanei TaxID=31234 RepID=E3MZS3_CAERE|nr:hypothetical protein CRE_07709 [Caenorhabditis remanei]